MDEFEASKSKKQYLPKEILHQKALMLISSLPTASPTADVFVLLNDT
jgi:hypothetical protein